MMAKHLQAFLDDVSILDSCQSSFWPGHGIEAALVTLTDDLFNLTALFNTVDHDLLTHHLTDDGI